jgi:sulfatase modifying factor 1
MKKILLIFLLVILSISLSGCGSEPAPTKAVTQFQAAGIDPDSWARVPAGEFLEGQFEHQGYIEQDFEIMATEVTNTQYARYLGEALAAGKIKINEQNQVLGYYPGDEFTGGRHELEIPAGEYVYMPLNDPACRISYDGREFTVKEGYGNHPVTMVSWFGANAYAEFYGYSLPSDSQWQKAARGEDNRAFPWGDHVGHKYMNYYHSGDPFETEEGFSDTTPVGFYNGKLYGDFQTADNSSPYGVYDLAGNAGEWTKDKIYGYHYRHIRGGSKATYEIDARIWKYDSAEPQYVSPSVGFRCVRDVR